MIESLAPVWDRHAKVLILGSMPGEASLRQQQYYAHPRNAFWPIMGALLGAEAGPGQLYPARLQALRRNGVAVWDVLAACERVGSLDSRINRASETPNAISALLEGLDEPRAILLNGGKAQASFQRFLQAEIQTRWPQLLICTMPSTSPAHAALSTLDKQAVWSRMLEILNRSGTEASTMATKKAAAKKVKPKAKKAAVKKAAPKKAAAKAAVKKAVAKKAPAKKKGAAKKAVKKATKKVAAKKKAVAAKKPVAKKVAAKKVAKKAVKKVAKKLVKKAAPKAAKKVVKAAKPVAKKAPAKKLVAKKPKAKPAAKKKAAAKPAAPVVAAAAPVAAPVVVKAPAPKKPVVKKKPAPKPAPAAAVAAPVETTADGSELVNVAVIKQPLVKPEPWQFGGRSPTDHPTDEGAKAQPDAERLAGKSRKVH